MHHSFNQLQPTVFIDAVPALRRGPSAERRLRSSRRRARANHAVAIVLAAAASAVLAVVHPFGVHKKTAPAGVIPPVKGTEAIHTGSHEVPSL